MGITPQEHVPNRSAYQRALETAPNDFCQWNRVHSFMSRYQHSGPSVIFQEVSGEDTRPMSTDTDANGQGGLSFAVAKAVSPASALCTDHPTPVWSSKISPVTIGNKVGGTYLNCWHSSCRPYSSYWIRMTIGQLSCALLSYPYIFAIHDFVFSA
ncbi:hypothetical protein BS47DRAFT_1336136 [Hydnum rufescens UP504]|uniref:Uncharacterized protein n=1 Tax=Hydnum rufescens UP504 TaxID=1448309 RepID=A0A9P6E1V5_9AGAM|nr:hypothetical protein BS47DRAFT_1336136 [Hydnum rufescens UP504]